MRRILIAVALVLALGACALVPREFRVEIPGRELVAPVTVKVVDRVGLVTAVADARFAPAPVGHGVFQGEPGVLLVRWLGGMCDHATTLTVEERGGALTITEVTERAVACLLAGISRDVAIGINRPVDPATVVFEPSVGRP